MNGKKIAIIEIDKPKSKKLNIEIILLIIALAIMFLSPFIMNKKAELPLGTLSTNRLNGQVTIQTLP